MHAHYRGEMCARGARMGLQCQGQAGGVNPRAASGSARMEMGQLVAGEGEEG